MNQPLGILDSGVGGLTIWQEIVTQLPHESTLYIADSKNCPYGTKPSEQIYKLSKSLIDFLVKKRCKLIVIACNTITVTCLDRLRGDFPTIPLIGTVPVIKTAAEQTKNKKIGILSTVRTTESHYQKDLIEKFAEECEVSTVGTDTLVPLIEKGSSEEEIATVIERVLAPFKKINIDVLALGCSHFPVVKKLFQEILGKNVQILDSGGAIARQAEFLQKMIYLQLRKSLVMSFTQQEG